MVPKASARLGRRDRIRSLTRPIVKRDIARAGAVISMVAPALIILTVFKLYPMLGTVRLSFYEWDGWGLPTDFVGISNFVTLFREDEVFRRAVTNTVQVFIITTVGVNAIGLILASILNSKIRGTTFFRVVVFIPVVISIAAASLLWIFVLDPYVGLITPVLQGLGLDSWIRPWLADPTISLITVSLISIWKSFGFFTIIYLAGLQTIPSDVEEAATLDGANSRQLMRHISIPLLRPFIATSVTLCIIGGFSIFDLIFVLTGGGPIHATESIVTYMYYQGFVRLEPGYASAVAVILCVMILIVYLLMRPITMKWNTR